MAWRIPAETVLRGTIDNTRKGIIFVELHLCGAASPILLTLHGHPGRDMAGCRVEFVRRVDSALPLEDFDLDLPFTQSGTCGDISASVKRRIPDVSTEEAHQLEEEGLPVPFHYENILYLEWFTREDGRFVLEGPGLDIAISEPQWEMSDEDERQSIETINAAIQGFIDNIAGERMEPKKREMNEFEWEEFLKECDRRTDAIGELLEKFGYDEEGWEKAGEFMGWNHFRDATEKKAPVEKGADEPAWEAVFDEEEQEDEDRFAAYLRQENAIGQRVSALLARRRTEGDTEPGEAQEAFDFALTKLRVKLAGALNTIAEDDLHPEVGMTIALLKRTLSIVSEAMALFDPAQVPEDQRTEVFDIRQDILDHITQLRQSRG